MTTPNENNGQTDSQYSEKDAIDTIKFLIQQHYEEVKLFWVRTNVFLILNIAASAQVVSKLGSDKTWSTQLVIGIAVGGVMFCLIWLQVNRMSKFYENRWKADAIRLAREHESTVTYFFYSLDFREYPKEFGTENVMRSPYKDRQRPWGPGATMCARLLVVLMAQGWLGILLYVLY